MILQVSPDVLGPYLMDKFSVSEHRLGFLTAAFYFSYMVMQIPAGILLDRFGPHRMLTLSALICALSSILFSITPYLFLASIARLFMGIGSSFVFIGSLKLIAAWFPKKRFTGMVGLLMTFGMLGGVIGEAPLSRVVEYIGWRESMFLLGFFGIIQTLLVFLLIKDSPSSSSISEQDSSESKKLFCFFCEKGRELFRNKQLWLVSVYTGILSIAPMMLSSLYGIPFLVAKYDIPETTAARMISLIFIGILIGCPFWGWLTDRMERRLPPMLMAAIFTPLILLILAYFSLSLVMASILLFALGFFGCASLPAFSIVREINRPEYTGTALGVLNTFDTLGVTIMLPLFGRFLDVFGSGVIHQHAYVYGIVDYQISLTFIVVIMMVSLMLLPFIEETYAKERFPKANVKVLT
jgi:MFS family permease